MIRAQIAPAILLTFMLTILTGIIFPIVIWAMSQVLFPYQANGSLIVESGHTIGSELIGQTFSLPQYFHPRPSAAGSGYDARVSGGTNLGPTSKKLILGLLDDASTFDVDESYQGVEMLARSYRNENGLPDDALLPPDAVTRSASGLDPHISFANAHLQSARIAKERNLKTADVIELIKKVAESRFVGIFGELRVNVLRLNLALDHPENS